MDFTIEMIGEFIGMGFGSLMNPILWIVAIWLAVKNESFQTILIWPALTNAVCWTIIMQISISHMGGPNVSIFQMFLAAACAGLMLGCGCYLVGKIFRNTSFANQVIANSSKISPNHSVDHDDLYKKAYEEMSLGQFEPASWAKAFTNAEGEQEKTKAFYIKYRVEQLATLESKKMQINPVQANKLDELDAKNSVYRDNKKLVALCVFIGLVGVILLISQKPWLSKEVEIQQWMKYGEAYYSGQGVQQDYNKAFQWYQKAADRGDTAAQSILGIMYTTFNLESVF